MPQNRCKQSPQLKNQSRTYVFAETAVPKNQLSSKSGNSAAPCPAVTRNIYSSRLRRNRSAVPSRSPGELIQKRGPAGPLYWPSGIVKGAIGSPLDRLSLHRRRRFLSPRERKGGRTRSLAGTASKSESLQVLQKQGVPGRSPVNPIAGTARIKCKNQRFCKTRGTGAKPRKPPHSL